MNNLTFWMGSEESAFSLDLQIRRLFEDKSLLNSRITLSEDDYWEENPVGINLVGNENKVAVVSVNGATMNKTSWWTRLLGIPTYQDIKERISEAAEAPKVKATVLALDTPGGYADGTAKLANFIGEISAKVKPVFTVADGSMASAGLWYGSAGVQTIVDPEGQIGSLGVIAVHMEQTSLMEKVGIKPTVFRTSPYKALGSPYEKLTEDAEKELKRELNFMHERFVAAVAENRGLSKEYVQNNIASGRMFRAQESLSLKLADQALSLEDTVARLLKGLDNAPAT